MGSKIIIIDDSKTFVFILRDLLTKVGFEVEFVMEGKKALGEILRFQPDLILLDVLMSDLDGIQFCRALSNDTRTSHLPIIFISSKAKLKDKVAGLEAGADDYITKPFAEDELIARIKSHLRRAKHERAFSPLTGLPGNILIEEKVKEILAEPGRKFALLYLDLDNFKSYNDVYGFFKGDDVLLTMGRIIEEVIKEQGNTDDFVGHIGGDDFVAITTFEKVDSICQEIITRLEEQRERFYNEKDFQKGYIETKNRRGNKERFPLITLSIAVVHNEKREIKTHWEVAEIAAEVKKYAKQHQGSICIKDKRS